jgi:UDP-N-acetylglucosamine--N-acetylmuramyl-(pentapeptide) pyrophosphoryl-undecaprenol N-acetylglucosamine transferase
LVLLVKATGAAKRELRQRRPDAVFSTGGYSAAPVMAAARSLGIPFTIHESNSVPGRANRMFASAAGGFTCTFKSTVQLVAGGVRTGQPIRRELREAAAKPVSASGTGLVVGIGGSQGSEFLNSVVPQAAPLLKSDAQILLASGKNNYERFVAEYRSVKGLRIVPYLETAELVDAYGNATVAVARSGGTVAEFALFGLPSVLIPLPTSADNHQLRNAQEFVEFGGAILLEQSEATPERLAASLDRWLESPAAREKASAALRKWDAPDATERIVDGVERAANRHN